MFQPQTRLQRLQAYKEFLTAKLLLGEDVQLFVNCIRRLCQDAIIAGCERPSEEQLCYVLLMGLPEDCCLVVTLMETLKQEEYTSERIKSLITGEYRRRMSAKTDQPDDVMTAEKVWLAS